MVVAFMRATETDDLFVELEVVEVGSVPAPLS
jgi:hypothetical protein